MTPLLWLVILSSALLVAALVGPRLIARSAPVLASVPRLAAAALTVGALVWITGLVFLGPLVAWIGVGPEWLPAKATELCQRCLAASSPFGASNITYAIPAFIPLSVPFLGAVLIVVGTVQEVRRTLAASREVRTAVVAGGRSERIHGHRVWVSDAPEPEAFALPAGRGGIVVSRGTLDLLTDDELASVLAHEQAHLDQRHHAWLAALLGATHYFRWIPCIASIRSSVASLLEIAADRAAGRATAPTGVAAALLKLGQLEANLTHARLLPAPPAVMNAVGSERVRSLVGVAHPKGSRALLATLLACGCMLALAVGVVHWPYVLALLTGC